MFDSYVSGYLSNFMFLLHYDDFFITNFIFYYRDGKEVYIV